MKNLLYISLFAGALLSGCASNKSATSASSKGSAKVLAVTPTPLLNDNTYKLISVSADPTYGFSGKNPVKVGGSKEGPKNERRYLNALTGPNGEKVTYTRLTSCCHFKTPNGMLEGVGLLDQYEVSYEGLPKPVILYINMYDGDDLKAPVGFKFITK